MKKILLAIVILMTSTFAFAQNAALVFNKYKNEKNATYMNVPRVMMSVAYAASGDSATRALVRQIHSVKILSLDECGKIKRRRFANQIKELTSKGYEELTSVKDGKDNVLFMGVSEGDFIKELVMLVEEADGCSAFLINGKMKLSDLAAIEDMVNK